MKTTSSKLLLFLSVLGTFSCASLKQPKTSTFVYYEDGEYSRKDRVYGEVSNPGGPCIEYQKIGAGRRLSKVIRCGEYYLLYKRMKPLRYNY